jgi:peptidoglycan hydrolase-like protein with peptidoglycan-binding domain
MRTRSSLTLALVCGGTLLAAPALASDPVSKAEHGYDPVKAMRLEFAQDDVRHVQQALKDRGYDPGPVNGRLDEPTQAALRNFQRDRGLTTTGEPNPATLAALANRRPQ